MLNNFIFKKNLLETCMMLTAGSIAHTKMIHLKKGCSTKQSLMNLGTISKKIYILIMPKNMFSGVRDR